MLMENLLKIDGDLEAALLHCSSLPSPPEVASRIIKLGENPDVTMAEVVETIRYDPALASKILRMANSPLHGHKNKIENLHQAITMFGLSSTLTMALSFSLASELSTECETGLDHSLYWRRSITAAAASVVLGEHLAMGRKETLFLAALLQDIGVLALYHVQPNIYQGLGQERDSHIHFRELEQARMGVDHAAVGAWLLNHWNMPKEIIACVAGSHDPLAGSAPAELEPMICCVALAGEIADIWSNESIGITLLRMVPKSEQLLGLGSSDMVQILESVADQVQDVARTFEINLGNTTVLESLKERAQEILTLRSM